MSIFLFFLVLFVLILVHEWGHFIVAKKTGMRVDEFGIGFPPKLFGFKKGETEYTFNVLPIGGFVKIWGENGEETPVSADEKYAGSESGTKAVDYSRSFSSRPKWAQALVLVAGVTMNILFAWFLFSLTFMLGVHTSVTESEATDAADLYITAIIPNSPASVLPVGSIVSTVGFGNREIASPTPGEFSALISEAGANLVKITYINDDDKEVTTELTPVTGLIDSDQERYAVGVSLSLVEVIKQPFFIALKQGLFATWQGFTSVALGLFTLLSQAVVGEADFSQVAGPVGIVGMVGDAASFGLTALLTFTAIISINLAVINLLPFPALDGGRLVFVAIEAVTRKNIPPVWAGRVNLVGFLLLMLLMVVVTYNDVVKIL